MMKLAILTIMTVSAFSLMAFAGAAPRTAPVAGLNGAVDAAAKKYTCPMHPEVISDKPGKCPKCGMNLVPVKS